MNRLLPCLLLALLWSCNANESKSDVEVAEPDPSANSQFAQVEQQLKRMTQEALQHSDTSAYTLRMLALVDEQGLLWRSPPKGMSGWLGPTKSTVQMPLFFQDANQPTLYHFQGSAQDNDGTHPWTGSLTLIGTMAPPLADGWNLLWGSYRVVQDASSPHPITYHGLARALYRWSADSSEITWQALLNASDTLSPLNYQGYRISADSAVAEWATWGVGGPDQFTSQSPSL